jgi:hypothetical protein
MLPSGKRCGGPILAITREHLLHVRGESYEEAGDEGREGQEVSFEEAQDAAVAIGRDLSAPISAVPSGRTRRSSLRFKRYIDRSFPRRRSRFCTKC